MAAAASGRRFNLRAVPWLVALVGLAIPLVGSGLELLPLVAAWLVILALVWVIGRVAVPNERRLRFLVALAALPVLFLAGWEGGWWLIPADVAWLIIEVASRAD